MSLVSRSQIVAEAVLARLSQVTRATYELLADQFECEPRGTIAVKGKGEMEAWSVLGLRPGVGSHGQPELEPAAISGGRLA